MTEQKLKYYVCTKMKLLTHLLKKGYVYIKTDKDRNNPRYDVWLFEDTPALREEVSRYYENEPKKGVSN